MRTPALRAMAAKGGVGRLPAEGPQLAIELLRQRAAIELLSGPGAIERSKYGTGGMGVALAKVKANKSRAKALLVAVQHALYARESTRGNLYALASADLYFDANTNTALLKQTSHAVAPEIQRRWAFHIYFISCRFLAAGYAMLKTRGGHSNGMQALAAARCLLQAGQPRKMRVGCRGIPTSRAREARLAD